MSKAGPELNRIMASTILEWPDIVALLQRIIKTLSRVSKSEQIEQTILIKLFKKCHLFMNPKLPAGVHSKVMELFKVIWPLFTEAEKQLYLQHMIMSLQSFGFISMKMKATMIEVFDLFLDTPLDACSIPVIASILPGIEEEQSETFNPCMQLLSKICTNLNDSLFFTSFFHVIVNYKDCRIPALYYLIKKLPNPIQHEDIVYLFSNDQNIVTCAIESCFNDYDPTSLIHRFSLDFLLLLNPLLFDMSCSIRLINAAILTCLKRDMSLNKRLFQFICPNTLLYSELEPLLLIVLKSKIISDPSNAFKIATSLLDKPMLLKSICTLIPFIIDFLQSNSFIPSALVFLNQLPRHLAWHHYHSFFQSNPVIFHSFYKIYPSQFKIDFSFFIPVSLCLILNNLTLEHVDPWLLLFKSAEFTKDSDLQDPTPNSTELDAITTVQSLLIEHPSLSISIKSLISHLISIIQSKSNWSLLHPFALLFINLHGVISFNLLDLDESNFELVDDPVFHAFMILYRWFQFHKIKNLSTCMHRINLIFNRQPKLLTIIDSHVHLLDSFTSQYILRNPIFQIKAISISWYPNSLLSLIHLHMNSVINTIDYHDILHHLHSNTNISLIINDLVGVYSPHSIINNNQLSHIYKCLNHFYSNLSDLLLDSLFLDFIPIVDGNIKSICNRILDPRFSSDMESNSIMLLNTLHSVYISRIECNLSEFLNSFCNDKMQLLISSVSKDSDSNGSSLSNAMSFISFAISISSSGTISNVSNISNLNSTSHIISSNTIRHSNTSTIRASSANKSGTIRASKHSQALKPTHNPFLNCSNLIGLLTTVITYNPLLIYPANINSIYKYLLKFGYSHIQLYPVISAVIIQSIPINNASCRCRLFRLLMHCSLDAFMGLTMDMNSEIASSDLSISNIGSVGENPVYSLSSAMNIFIQYNDHSLFNVLFQSINKYIMDALITVLSTNISILQSQLIENELIRNKCLLDLIELSNNAPGSTDLAWYLVILYNWTPDSTTASSEMVNAVSNIAYGNYACNHLLLLLNLMIKLNVNVLIIKRLIGTVIESLNSYTDGNTDTSTDAYSSTNGIRNNIMALLSNPLSTTMSMFLVDKVLIVMDNHHDQSSQLFTLMENLNSSSSANLLIMMDYYNRYKYKEQSVYKNKMSTIDVDGLIKIVNERNKGIISGIINNINNMNLLQQQQSTIFSLKYNLQQIEQLLIQTTRIIWIMDNDKLEEYVKMMEEKIILYITDYYKMDNCIKMIILLIYRGNKYITYSIWQSIYYEMMESLMDKKRDLASTIRSLKIIELCEYYNYREYECFKHLLYTRINKQEGIMVDIMQEIKGDQEVEEEFNVVEGFELIGNRDIKNKNIIKVLNRIIRQTRYEIMNVADYIDAEVTS